MEQLLNHNPDLRHAGCFAALKANSWFEGFEWIDLNHRQESVICFRRKGKRSNNDILVILNMTPVVRNDWKIYAKGKPHWKEIYNSDAKKYGGTGDVLNPSPGVKLVDKKSRIFEINIHLPALGGVVLK